MTAIPKPLPRYLEKRTEDRAENAKVKVRSAGQCEVTTPCRTAPFWIVAVIDHRCPRRAAHIHHLIAGIGRRNIGRSILAAHKLHVCDRCYKAIHGHVLTPLNEGERYDAATVRYERRTA